MRAALALVYALIPVAAAPQDAAWQPWAYSRPIEVSVEGNGDLVRVALPRELMRQLAPKLRDLRVLDQNGGEVPYVLDLIGEPPTREWRPTVITDTGTVRGSYTQVVLDTGEGDELHDSLELEVGEDDFLARVEIAASPDVTAGGPEAAAWRVVAEGLPIYRSAATGLRGSTRVRYPATRDRWLRVRLEGETPLEIKSSRVSHRQEVEPELVLLADEAESIIGDDRSSIWRLDAGGHTLASRIDVGTDTPSFHRPIEIRTSADGETWRRAGEGQIYRFEDGDPLVVRERKRVSFSEVRGRHYEVRIYDGDDVALSGREAAGSRQRPLRRLPRPAGRPVPPDLRQRPHCGARIRSRPHRTADRSTHRDPRHPRRRDPQRRLPLERSLDRAQQLDSVGRAGPRRDRTGVGRLAGHALGHAIP